MTVCGIQPTARRWKASWSPILSMASTGWRTIARNLARRTPMSVRIAMSRPLRRDDLEVHRREDEIGEEQEEEGHHDAEVERVADPLRTALGVHAAVRGHDAGDEPEDQRLDRRHDEVRQLGERAEGHEVGAGGAPLEHDVEHVAAGDADDR